MSNPPSVGGTLSVGIQDVAAILPLLGTEQCEKHVGSALKGGYLYAAAAPLSIFGSLGIVKAGIAILVSSISISIPQLSVSFTRIKPFIKYSGHRKWFGGKLLQDAGFELTGGVAPLIAMDSHRFRAETRLIEMLEEKHIDDYEQISIDWKSKQWNVMLVLSTIAAAALAMTPYFALLLGPKSLQPNQHFHFPWLFPFLRAIGGATATVACQLIIQSRVISIMKNRILFMTIHQQLETRHKESLAAWASNPAVQWDKGLPAEQCVQSLEQYILSGELVLVAKTGYISIPMGIPARLSSPMIIQSHSDVPVSLDLATNLSDSPESGPPRSLSSIPRRPVSTPSSPQTSTPLVYPASPVVIVQVPPVQSVSPVSTRSAPPIPSRSVSPVPSHSSLNISTPSAPPSCVYIPERPISSISTHSASPVPIPFLPPVLPPSSPHIPTLATPPLPPPTLIINPQVQSVSPVLAMRPPSICSSSSEHPSTGSSSEPPVSHSPVFAAPLNPPHPAASPVPPIMNGTSFDIDELRRLRQVHFPTPISDTVFVVLFWIVLAISLPATVAGYLGCFTLVSSTAPTGKGPLIWLGLEAALSILRIAIWASNPYFDENTEVSLKLKLSGHQPMITTNHDGPGIRSSDANHKEQKSFDLVSEREFLERITPFTGPLDPLQKADTVNLYFTLARDSTLSQICKMDLVNRSGTYLYLFMTVFDSNMQMGASILFFKEKFVYFDAVVRFNTISKTIDGQIRSKPRLDPPWRSDLFDSLEKYYQYIHHAVCWKDIAMKTATLQWNWDFSPKSVPAERGVDGSNSRPIPILSTAHDRLYTDRGYEHQLKSNLVTRWGEWILEDIKNIRSQSRIDCHEALKDATSDQGKWELRELDAQLSWALAKRELVLVTLSLELEDILRTKMETFVSDITRVREDQRLRSWIYSEFDSERRKRMDQERLAAKKRMEDVNEQLNWEVPPDQDEFPYAPLLDQVITFIEEQWLAATNNRHDQVSSEDRLAKLVHNYYETKWHHNDRDGFLQQFRKRVSYEHWIPQHEVETTMMKTTIEHVRDFQSGSNMRDWITTEVLYRYPEPDLEATSKFVKLESSSTQRYACSAVVYDASNCGQNAVCHVIAKTTTRSVMRVDPDIVGSIPPNDHLLFLECFQGDEPAFVQRNRDRWWDEQTTNSSIFYFTPKSASGDSCSSNGTTIARILLFITQSSAPRIRVVDRGQDVTSVSILENKKEIAMIPNVPPAFQLQSFEPFTLPEGRHELELVPHVESGTSGVYDLRDILIEFPENPAIQEEEELGDMPSDQDFSLIAQDYTD